MQEPKAKGSAGGVADPTIADKGDRASCRLRVESQV